MLSIVIIAFAVLNHFKRLAGTLVESDLSGQVWVAQCHLLKDTSTGLMACQWINWVLREIELLSIWSVSPDGLAQWFSIVL